MARDLHDLLGRTLSMITLKSELAGRLLERDPRSATHEILEVERVARQALREVREVVAGYRQRTLRSELDGARQILEAAGVACTIEWTARTLSPAIDTVLAWAVREGVTNVIRHSRAGHCSIRITSTDDFTRAEVSNDGYLQGSSSTSRNSSGLSGLAERVAELGGHIEAGPQAMTGGPGFRLWVEIPAINNRATEAR